MQIFILLFVKLLFCVWILYGRKLSEFIVYCKSFILLTINYIDMRTFKSCCLELLWKKKEKTSKTVANRCKKLQRNKKMSVVLTLRLGIALPCATSKRAHRAYTALLVTVQRAHRWSVIFRTLWERHSDVTRGFTYCIYTCVLPSMRGDIQV